jgi:hypothetical protein
MPDLVDTGPGRMRLVAEIAAMVLGQGIGLAEGIAVVGRIWCALGIFQDILSETSYPCCCWS